MSHVHPWRKYRRTASMWRVHPPEYLAVHREHVARPAPAKPGAHRKHFARPAVKLHERQQRHRVRRVERDDHVDVCVVRREIPDAQLPDRKQHQAERREDRLEHDELQCALLAAPQEHRVDLHRRQAAVPHAHALRLRHNRTGPARHRHAERDKVVDDKAVVAARTAGGHARQTRRRQSCRSCTNGGGSCARAEQAAGRKKHARGRSKLQEE
eukprot:32728-Chlamydomonas_euryale.AAC.1